MSVPVDEPTPFDAAVEAVAARIAVAFPANAHIPAERFNEGARVALEAIDGHLRGRTPFPLPRDLMGVAVQSGIRIFKGFAHSGTQMLNHGLHGGTVELTPWNGFLMVEKVTLNRYRQRTA